MAKNVDLAGYLFTRLRQIGVRGIHGVPGDYNLTALDYVSPAGLDWIGSCNELNAGYAADGYARIKGVGALVTAFGVGELSALNAVAGAYTESAAVVHIVGTPARTLQKRGVFLHHSLGNGDFRVFADMYAKVTVAQANLIDPETAADMIDHTLQQCLLQSRPVYIELPTDMVAAKVSAERLSKPLVLLSPTNDPQAEDNAVDVILDKIYSSTRPFILVDMGADRCGISKEVHELVCTTGFPTATTPMGKGILDETLPNFHGIYAAGHGKLNYKEFFDSSDLVLNFGPHNSDVNTSGFTTIPDPGKTIAFHRTSVDIGGSGVLSTLHTKSLMRTLLKRLDRSRLPRYDPYPDLGSPRDLIRALPPTSPDAIIDQNTFYQRMSNFLRPGDIVMVETGTPAIGARDFVFPKDVKFISSGTWLSIGYMLPAAQGAALAQRELMASGAPKGRTILFEGDGSLQMTAQEISTIIRQRLSVTIFVINNDGYTIERYINGMDAHYNDVAAWRYLEAPSFFGAPTDGSYKVQTHRAANWGELLAVLESASFQDSEGLKMVEVMMEKKDAPETLKEMIKAVVKRNLGGVE